MWAPNAARIWVIGSFNGWDETADEMTRLEPDTMGIFELFIPGIEEGALYKYLIETKDGNGSIRRIHMQIMQSFVRERHLPSRI